MWYMVLRSTSVGQSDIVTNTCTTVGMMCIVGDYRVLYCVHGYDSRVVIRAKTHGWLVGNAQSSFQH